MSAELIHVGQLRDGDYVLCVPGDIVPRDGKVVDGTAVVKNLVNEAPLAESALQALRVGSTVGAGSRVLARFIVVQIGRYNSSTSR